MVRIPRKYQDLNSQYTTLVYIHTDTDYLLIGSISCVCTVVALWDLAASGSSAGGILYLQHRRTRCAELTETALEVLIQVAIKNRVQTTARGKNGHILKLDQPESVNH